MLPKPNDEEKKLDENDDDHKSGNEYALISASMRGNLEEVKNLLLEPNRNVNAVDDKGNSALHWAAYFDEPDVLELLINSPKVNLSLKSKRGNTVLHMAAIANAGNSLNLLLNLGTKESELLHNDQNNWGETPLHLAASTGKVKAVEILCKGNVDTTLKDNWNRTALRVAYENLEHDAKNALTQYCSPQTIEDAQNVQESRIKLDNDDNEGDKVNAPINNKKIMDEFMNEMKNLKNKIKQNDTYNKVKVKHIFAGKVIDKKQKENNAVVDDRTEENDKNAGNAGDIDKEKKYKFKLSSKMEYGVSPKTVQELESWLADDEIDNNGKDLFGWSALHKVIFWQKNEFVLPLLQHMSSETINCVGPEGEAVIHMALQLVLNGGKKTLLQWICECEKVDKMTRNKAGFTALEMAQKNNAGKEVVDMLSE